MCSLLHVSATCGKDLKVNERVTNVVRLPHLYTLSLLSATGLSNSRCQESDSRIIRFSLLMRCEFVGLFVECLKHGVYALVERGNTFLESL